MANIKQTRLKMEEKQENSLSERDKEKSGSSWEQRFS
jgi:hypothetical protein